MLGTTWQVITNLLKADKVKVRQRPSEGGVDGLVGHLDALVEGQAPQLRVPVDEPHLSPEVNAQVAEWFGEAPSNVKACEETADKNHCDTFHAADEAYFDQIAFWATPARTAATTAATCASTTPSGSRPGRRSRGEAAV